MATIELLAYLKKKPCLKEIIKLERTEVKKILVCDLNSVLLWIYLSVARNLAGEPKIELLDQMSRKITTFVSALRYVRIEPVFFFNSVTTQQHEEEFTFSLSWIKEKYIESLEPCPKISACAINKGIFSLNPLYLVQVQLLLLSLRVKTIYCLNNFVAEVATFTEKESDVCGVLSFNIEFALFAKVRLMNMDDFDLEGDIGLDSESPNETPGEIVCAYVNTDMLASEFGLSRAGLIDLVILLGNSYSVQLNGKYYIRKYLQLPNKGIEGVVNFLKKYRSPVFEFCSKLSYFLDLNKDYRFAFSQSLVLYNSPAKLTNVCEMSASKWIRRQVSSGKLPFYFYGIANWGIYLRQPFYEIRNVCFVTIHDKLISQRRKLYHILGKKMVVEYGITSRRVFVETEVEAPVGVQLDVTVEQLKRIQSLSCIKKCKLLSTVLLSEYHALDCIYLGRGLLRNEPQTKPCSNSVAYWILGISMHLFCRHGEIDSPSFDAMCISVITFLSDAVLTFPEHYYKNMSTDLSIVCGFSHTIQLVYDFAMLLGLTHYVPLPTSVYSPSHSLMILALKSEAFKNDVCRQYYATLHKNLFCISSLNLFRLKCLDPALHDHNELILLLEQSVQELSTQKPFLEELLSNFALDQKPQTNNRNGQDAAYMELNVNDDVSKNQVDVDGIFESKEEESTNYSISCTSDSNLKQDSFYAITDSSERPFHSDCNRMSLEAVKVGESIQNQGIVL